MTKKARKGYYFAKSASGFVGCVHKHRTHDAARECANGIHYTARVVFVPPPEATFYRDVENEGIES